MSRTMKEFIKLYGPLVLGIIIVSAWFLHSRNQNYQEIVSGRQGATVALGARIVTRNLADHASDAQFLARLVARSLVDDGGMNLRHVEDAFSDFSRSRSVYFQLRFLDESGVEKVRVDRSFAGPVISQESALQDKGGRYYFKESMRAGKNDVYISNFDLNVEHGRIEIPYRPTLRYSCPVVDNAGVKRGVVVLNYDGGYLLNQIKVQAEAGGGVTMLCNGEGFWMLGAKVDDEWGHIVEDAKEASMPNRFPVAWEVVSRADKGQVVTDRGLFSFDTVGIIPGEVMSDVPPTVEAAGRRWKILTWVPSAKLRVPWMTLYVFLICMFLVLLSVGCWHLANYRVHQDEVETKLRETEERTLAISQSSQDAIVMIDGQDLITHWNPAAEALFGFKRDEVMGQKLHELLVPDSMREDARNGMVNFATSGKGMAVGNILEFEALRKDGAKVPVELAISSFQFKDEWYAVGSMRDTTRRKLDELELKLSEQTSRALINAPMESAMLIEPNGTILSINEIGARWLDSSVDELVGKNVYALFPPELSDSRRGVIKNVVNSGEPFQHEDTRAGRVLLTNFYPVKNSEAVVEKIAIFARDVTEQRQAEAALMLSEQRFRDVSEAVGEFIWETDAKGAFTFITEDVVSVLGYSVAELLVATPSVLLVDEDVNDFMAWRTRVYERREAYTNIEVRNVTKDGLIIWLQLSGVPFYDNTGEFMGFRGAAMNITDRKATEDAIKASERKLRALAESAYDAIIMIDTNGLVSFWNDAAVNLFGYSEKEALGLEVHTLIASAEEQLLAERGMYQFAMTGNGPSIGHVQELEGRHKDGRTFPVERSIAGFRLGNVWYAVATIRDITERKATETKLHEFATTDGLTGLYNRRRFMELAEREFARSIRYDRPLALIMLDIDHFKDVNDTHGHDAGDVVLRSLSEIAITALRNADILGRLGGEEFAALLPETDEQAAMEVAERLRVSIERATMCTDECTLKITVSIGVSILETGISTIENMLKRADVALYDAKQSGRNRVLKG